MTNNKPIKIASKEGELYIISTPIGNLADITLRALEVLKNCDIVYCEDTRVSKKLFSHHGIKTKLDTYNDVNGHKKREHIIDELNSAKKIGLISDAGTPLISDPGYKLISEAKKLGLKITPIPGASSVFCALAASGLPTDEFTFCGFFDYKKHSKKTYAGTIIFFESAKRLVKTLQKLQAIFGNVNACVARELTKLYEEIKTNKLSELEEYYQSNPPKGEIVILINSTEKKQVDASLIEDEIKKLLGKHKLKEISEIISAKFEISKKSAYEIALKIKT